MDVPDTTHLPCPAENFEHFESLGQMYEFFRQEIYANLEPKYKHKSCIDTFFLMTPTQLYMDRNCPLGKEWRKSFNYRWIVEAVEKLDREIEADP